MAARVHHAAATPAPDPGTNLERIHSLLLEAGRQGVMLLVTPELFVTAEATTDGSLLRERLRWMARSTGVGLIASTPETTDTATYIGADWWDSSGNLVAHERKHRLAEWQFARGFTAWDERPLSILTSMYSDQGIKGRVALGFADDLADPAYEYYLRDHGVSRFLELGPASTRSESIEPAPAWAPKHTGIPFPQPGPLPEPLLRPLPRITDSWWETTIRPAPGWGS